MATQLSTQQAQTFSFFDATSAEWRMKAEGRLQKVNVIAQRNGCVHRVQHALRSESLLDVGCGTGELVIDMAAQGVPSIGIDFAPEMIRACEQKRLENAVGNARFHCCSVFDYEAEEESQALISALGFIEYISPDELRRFLTFCRRTLRQDGALAVGSRNRLFNLVSMNEYTAMEMSLGTVETMLGEALALERGAALDDIHVPNLPRPEAHPLTRINVTTRHQYTPGELSAIVREAGLTPIAIYPVHFHPMPPAAAERLKPMYIDFSSRIFETAPEEHRLLPFSSSFVLAAQKL
jgi:2-polyprenyl-3-methyl-5-hydroxy-6-metoxy-1,4-benzoquinol methylase